MTKKMADLDPGGNHPILNTILMVVAIFTGAKGLHHNITAEELDFYDKLLAIVLKGVSIISFLLIILLNLNKLVKVVKNFFQEKKNGKGNSSESKE